mmetsp:Transcript_18321/g.46926  ORF Transcript_18321/g.46926 Transcript_18321/m.46926 type:complete len:249 (+) Transcript_18321:56-802(+)
MTQDSSCSLTTWSCASFKLPWCSNIVGPQKAEQETVAPPGKKGKASGKTKSATAMFDQKPPKAAPAPKQPDPAVLTPTRTPENPPVIEAPQAVDAQQEKWEGASQFSDGRSVGASSVGTEMIKGMLPAKERELREIQKRIKMFAKEMLRGQEMTALATDGQLKKCVVTMDRKLKNMKLEINQIKRSIELHRIDEIHQGTEPNDIETPLDELCSTLVLNTGECITFRFTTVDSMRHFATCLQILVDGQQ